MSITSVKNVYYELEDGIIYKKIGTYENPSLSKSILKVSSKVFIKIFNKTVSKKSVRFLEPHTNDANDAEQFSIKKSSSPKPVISNILSGFDIENKFEILANLSDTEC